MKQLDYLRAKRISESDDYILNSISVACSATVHVSVGGKDIATCGTILLPCLTVKYAVMESKKLADEVIIYGKHAGKVAVFHESEIQLNRTMKFIGKYGTPVILPVKYALLSASASRKQKLHVKFINIKFQGGSFTGESNNKLFIFAEDSSLHIVNCSFVSVPYPAVLLCSRECALFVSNSLIDSPSEGISVDGTSGRVSMIITGTRFIGKPGNSSNAISYGNAYEDKTVGFVEITLSHCVFSYFDAAVLLSPRAIHTRILIEYSTFQDNNILKKCLDILHLSSSVFIYASFSKRQKTIKTNLYLHVHSCMFQNNFAPEGSGISIRLENAKFQGRIENCTFENNHAWVTGGAISFYEYVDLQSNLLISKCHFANNTVEQYTEIENCESYAGRTYGSGGALSFSASSTFHVIEYNVVVYSCTFISNFASTVGGTIYVFLSGLTLQNSSIITPRKSANSMTDGTAIAIKGCGYLFGVKINVNDHYPQGSVVRIDGEVALSAETSLSCPVGTTFKSMQVTYSGEFQYLLFSCNPCAISKYNLNGSTFSRLRVKEPFCKDCPPGASCKHGRLRPVDNYWGFLATVNSNLSFIELPPGYGCTNKQCTRYDSCAKNRQGTLCSTCMKGYSESLFSPECIRNEDCDKRSFYAVAATLVIVYLLFFIYKKSILRIIKTQLLWFKSLERGRNRGNAYSVNGCDENRYIPFTMSESPGGHSARDGNGQNPQDDSSGGLVKIVFYFYQIEALLDFYGGKMEHDIVTSMKGLFQNIFNFNFFNSSGSSSCAMIDTTPVTKIIMRGIFVAAVLVAFILLYIICRILQRKAIRCCKKRSIFTNTKSTFGDRVLAALFEVVLLSYGIITKAITSMLDCKTVGNKQVLYLQGDVQCYQTWQYGLAAAGLAWVVPFCLYVNLLPNLIREKQVETKGLFFGCVFPIPMIMYCLIRKVVAKCSTESQQQQAIDSEESNCVNDDGMRQEPFENSINDVEENCNDLISTVQQILCGPFKDKVNSSKFLSWDGVYIFRRLFIVSVFVFVEDATYKLYVILAGQILILMHHSHVKPYKSKFLNFLESASLGFLVLINGMNLLSVYDFAHGISEVGDNLLLLKIFAWIETVLHLLVPTLIITSLAVLLIVRCFYIIFKILRYLIRSVMRLCSERSG